MANEVLTHGCPVIITSSVYLRPSHCTFSPDTEMANRQLVLQPRICPALAISQQRGPLSNSISNFPATPRLPLQQAAWQDELVHLHTSKSDTSFMNYLRASIGTTLNPSPTTAPTAIEGFLHYQILQSTAV